MKKKHNAPYLYPKSVVIGFLFFCILLYSFNKTYQSEIIIPHIIFITHVTSYIISVGIISNIVHFLKKLIDILELLVVDGDIIDHLPLLYNHVTDMSGILPDSFFDPLINKPEFGEQLCLIVSGDLDTV